MKIYQLEVTSICNLRCSFCAREKQWAHREHGFMNPELISRIDWSDTEYVELQLAGEPTLHPQLEDIVRELKSRGLMVGLSTNSTNPAMDLSQVDVLTCTTDRERSISLKGPNVFNQKLGEDYPYEDTSHSKRVYEDAAKKCFTPFKYVSIHWDGDVVPCCKCFGKQHVFGSLYDMTFEEIIESSKRKEFLRNMTESSNYICSYCAVPNPHKIHKKLIAFAKGEK